MIRHAQRFTRTDTLFPSPALFPSRMRRYRLHPTLEFSLAHRPEQLFRMCGAVQPPVDQRDGVGMERVPADTRDRAVKMRLDAPEQRSPIDMRSEEHTSVLQSLMRISYAVFCLKKKNNQNQNR